MGINILSGLLKRLNQAQQTLNGDLMERLGRFANACLAQSQPDVRRAITELSVELHDMLQNEEAFWRMINPAGKDQRNLLTYFIAKRSAQPGRS